LGHFPTSAWKSRLESLNFASLLLLLLLLLTLLMLLTLVEASSFSLW